MTRDEQREVIRRRRTTTIGKLALSLSPDQMRAYKEWQDRCRRMGIPITPKERSDWLFDCKEMPR